MTELQRVDTAVEAEWHETGLVISNNTSFDAWLTLGDTLKRMDRAVQWWVGDWLNFGEHAYGEMYSQAVDETDSAYQTLRNYKWVSSAIPLSLRRDNVAFGVAAEIARLPDSERAAAMRRAGDEGWTVREARKHVNELKALGNKSTTTRPPEGRYDCIVIDPPWPMEKIEREVRPNQKEFAYPTMTEDEILGIELPAASNCHVWCWTTQRFLPLAFSCFESWGVRYVCTFVWHKPGGFQPVGLPQYNAEFVLYGRIGSPKFVSTKEFFTAFTASRGAHSEKPDAFYDMVRNATGGPRIDMFARRSIEGFDAWGNEA